MNEHVTTLRLNQRISFKLIASLAVTLAVVLGASMGWVGWVVWSDFYRNAEQSSLSAVTRAQDVATAYIDTAKQSSQRDFALFKARYSIASFSVRPSDTTSGDTRTPTLVWNGEALNGQFAKIDAFTRETSGVVATLFVREGDDFRRITTSLKQQDGKRAVGTLLDRNHPAYPLILKGAGYVGPANLFGRPFMTVYEPLVINGQTVGIMFTGTDISDLMERLNASLRSIKVGDTGRVYAVQTRPGPLQGQLVGHDIRAL